MSEFWYQVAVSVFGAQHGGHLPQVGGVALLLHAAGERHGDDPLCDVDQVQFVGFVQRLEETRAPAGKQHRSEVSSSATRSHSFTSNILIWRRQSLQHKRWIHGDISHFLQLIADVPCGRTARGIQRNVSASQVHHVMKGRILTGRLGVRSGQLTRVRGEENQNWLTGSFSLN